MSAIVLRMPADPAEAEGAESSNAAPAPSKPAPTKVAYHPNVRCLRGGGGAGPVTVGPMYRVHTDGRAGQLDSRFLENGTVLILI